MDYTYKISVVCPHSINNRNTRLKWCHLIHDDWTNDVLTDYSRFSLFFSHHRQHLIGREVGNAYGTEDVQERDHTIFVPAMDSYYSIYGLNKDYSHYTVHF